MADLIYTRSPMYLQMTTTAESVDCTIDVEGVTVYELTKAVTNGVATFEISELVRDYITPVYNSASSGIEVDVVLTDGTATDTYDLYAIDGYLLYKEGIQSSATISNVNVIGVTPDDSGNRRVQVASGYDTEVGYALPSSNTDQRSVYTTATSSPVTLLGTTIYLDEIDCSKHDVIPVKYINKFGLWATFFFQMKHVERVDVESHSYTRSLLDYTNMTLDQYAHSQSRVVTGGKQRLTLNTQFLDEYYNIQMEELLFSEYVWVYYEGDWMPVQVETQSFEKKTHVNDKLVQYTISVIQASTYINTVR